MILPIDKLEPGMELRRDVSNANEVILLTAGTSLTAHHLRMLKSLGVQAIDVVGEHSALPNADLAIPSVFCEAAEEHVDYRLRHASTGTPSFTVWRGIAVHRTAARLANHPEPRSHPEANHPTKDGGTPRQTTRIPRLQSARKPRFASARAFVQQTTVLPSLPSLYYDLVQNTQNGDASIETICGIIRKDQSLVARLLKLANSVFYALPAPVDALEDAVQVIGFNEVQNLVLATSIIRAFDKLPADLVDVPSFWLHSIACATGSALLARKWYDPLPERFFVGGLLHDLGRLLMFLNAPQESGEILHRCETEGALVMDIERQVLGFDHVVLGVELASCWRLPASLSQMISSHHNPSTATGQAKDSFLVAYADFIASVLELGNSGELFPYPLLAQPSHLEYLLEEERIPDMVGDLEAHCAQLVPILTT